MNTYVKPQITIIEVEIDDICSVSVGANADNNTNTKSIFDIFN